ncbi:MAG TPA: hypothetical protein VEI54_11625 [Candidatus Limnocylindrales bacterium]|nr:hypothetical protein [Candidatus Limnocylindrales bacterium]
MKTRARFVGAGLRGAGWLLLGLTVVAPVRVPAQQPAGAGGGQGSLPDSPQPKTQGTTSPGTGHGPSFIGYMTNKSVIFPDIATHPGPLSAGGKFELFVNQSISPPYVVAAGLNAAYSQALNEPQAYGQGWDAYGSRFGASMARASSNSFFSAFLIASVLREDPRFFPQSNPTFWGSVKYSARRVFVTRTDAGGERFDTSGILGPLAAETLANAYLPRSEQTGAKTAERFGTDVAWRFAGYMFKNYWPTLFHDLGLNKLKVIPNPGSREQTGEQPKN